MLMTRRSFLGTILAAAVAPAIVRADSLMRIVPRETLFMDADLLLPDIGPFIDAMRPENIIGRVVSAEVVSLAGIDEYVITDCWHHADGRIKQSISHYRYNALDVIIELAPGVDPRTLRADGRPVDLRGAVIERTRAGIDTLRFPKLDLTDYGNRVPDFQLEVKE